MANKYAKMPWCGGRREIARRFQQLARDIGRSIGAMTRGLGVRDKTP